jgi:hypothetical protein
MFNKPTSLHADLRCFQCTNSRYFWLNLNRIKKFYSIDTTPVANLLIFSTASAHSSAIIRSCLILAHICTYIKLPCIYDPMVNEYMNINDASISTSVHYCIARVFKPGFMPGDSPTLSLGVRKIISLPRSLFCIDCEKNTLARFFGARPNYFFRLS